ncbi:MAG: type II CAAX endopeptidase family protein [Deltaproteobacteria bacterium]|nr:type II CAAX endopeptidase family protein [Deltaproteobacteria bacterium]
MRIFDILPRNADGWEPSGPGLPWGSGLSVAARTVGFILLFAFALELPTFVALPLNVLLLLLCVRATLLLDTDEAELRQERWKRLRLHRPRGTPTQWLKAALAFIVGSVATSLATICVTGPPTSENALLEKLFVRPEGVLLLVAAAGLLHPFFEEVIFRGWAYRVLSRWGGKKLAFILSATFWALAHFELARVPDLLLSAAALHLAMSATGSIWSCVALHAALNTSAIIAGYLFADSAGGEPPHSLHALPVYIAIGAGCGVLFVWQMRRIAITKTADDPSGELPTASQIAPPVPRHQANRSPTADNPT